MTLRTHYTDALQELDQQVLKMGVLVIEALNKAMKALINQNTELADKVIAEDAAVNDLEFLIDDRCTVMIATEQPVATDLRHLVCILKVVTQLERMGDHAVHVAKAAIKLNGKPVLDPIRKMPEMTNIILEMTNDVLSAFLHKDGEKANAICDRDDQVDACHEEIQQDIFDLMRSDKCDSDTGARMLFINRFLERAGDHVTNIAEWIVFEVTGEHQELNL